MNQNGNGRKWDCVSIGMSVGVRTFPKDMHEKHGIVGRTSRTYVKLLTIEGDVALILYHGGRIAHAFCLTPSPKCQHVSASAWLHIAMIYASVELSVESGTFNIQF